MSLPIIILAKDRPMQLKEMILSIEHCTADPHIIICDNNSTQPEAREYLENLSKHYPVFANVIDRGFEGFNSGLDMVDTDYFIISDPDIVLNFDTPLDWQELMIAAINEVNAAKIGVALSPFNIPNNAFGDRIRIAEGVARLGEIDFKSIPDKGNWALIDTTFCMLRRDTYVCWIDKQLQFVNGELVLPPGYISQDNYNPKYAHYPVRLGGRFTAKHTGWSMKEEYPSDYDWYKKSCNRILASTTNILLQYDGEK